MHSNSVMSNICGQSWALEPPEIKQLYSYYAEVERRNHSNAHPGYKISPRSVKRRIWKRKRAAPGNEHEDDYEQPTEAYPDSVFSPMREKRTSRKRKDVAPEDEAGDEADDEAEDEDDDDDDDGQF